ncbi:MAG: transcriptional repressor [Bacteroidales bacterium]|jgi:Fur family ferric uptake transcriptional regulator|nr:transcriptional repressor [Bacteroidales bacterium]
MRKKQPERVSEAVNRKRDQITKNLRTDAVPSEYNEALQIMEDYLRSQKKRCTVERRFILQALYQLSSPVDIYTLHKIVCADEGSVALTTVYNTLDLLVQLKLANRLELVSRGMTFFERTLGQEPHGFVICEQCGTIKVLRKLQVLQKFETQLPKGFLPEAYTLQIHGLCAKCQRANAKKKNK